MDILRTKDISESPWFQRKRVVYENDTGDALEWDYIERTDARTSVLILPRFKESGDILLGNLQIEGRPAEMLRTQSRPLLPGLTVA